MYFNQNPNDNRDTQTNLNHSTYHYTGPELNGRERSGEPKPGFFQRRQGNGKAPKQKKTASGRFGAGSVVAIALAAALWPSATAPTPVPAVRKSLPPRSRLETP